MKILKELLLKQRHLSKLHIAIIALVTAVSLGTVSMAGYVMYDYESLPEEMQIATVVEAAPAEEQVVEPEEEIIEETSDEKEPEETIKEIFLVGTSIEKDLKIKIQDQNEKLVEGERFSVTVKADKNDAKEFSYEDKDRDGLIYIDEIEAGDYTVTLEEIEGYIIQKNLISVTVKDKIEYKKVDVTAEIKTESQVNTAVEDTAVNDIPVESTLTDTLPLYESKVIAVSVGKDEIDAPGYSLAAAGNELNSVVCTMVLEETAEESEANPDENIEEEETDEELEANPDESIEDEETVEAQGEEVEILAEVPSDEDAKLNPKVKASEVIATVSIPANITLYDCEDEVSNRFKIALQIEGDASVVEDIDWSSSDESVVTWYEESSSIIVVREGKGSAEITAVITYHSDEYGNTEEKFLSSTVTVKDAVNSSEVLKDKSGNVLYIDEKAQTVATAKDYVSCDKFYRSPKYMGWQTIGGKVYYYNDQYEPVTGSQVIGGIAYNFASDGSLAQSSGNRGIDVSKYQGSIDWGAVAASGISFAIIRAGYRGSATGVLVEDPYFRQNIAGATKAGIKVGVYFFTQAISEAEAVEEASMAMSLVSGYRLSYPIFIDTELASNGRANGLSKSARTAIVKAFCQTVQSGGYKAGVYASKNWYQNQLNASALSSYCIWVAQYAAECNYSGKYDMWQYTEKGTVSGIKGNVDMNIGYTNY